MVAFEAAVAIVYYEKPYAMFSSLNLILTDIQ